MFEAEVEVQSYRWKKSCFERLSWGRRASPETKSTKTSKDEETIEEKPQLEIWRVRLGWGWGRPSDLLRPTLRGQSYLSIPCFYERFSQDMFFFFQTKSKFIGSLSNKNADLQDMLPIKQKVDLQGYDSLSNKK